MIGNGLILMHISPFFTQIVTGAIILVGDLAQHALFTPGFRLRRPANDRSPTPMSAPAR